MRKIKFTKMVASGNDFIVIRKSENLSVSLRGFAKKACDRKYGIGADGLLVVDKSKVADARMRIFNADGSEAEMCGNGARCFAYFLSAVRRPQAVSLGIETKAGIINAQVNKDNIRINLTDPKDIKLDIPIVVNGRKIKTNFINTGVPHAVIFVEGLEKIDVNNLGREIRYHKQFSPAGTNVDFVEALDKNSIRIRTYERGVEDETLACGTGSVAASLIFSLIAKDRRSQSSPAFHSGQATGDEIINVHTQGGEILKVYFDRVGNEFSNVWLEGEAKIVYQGEYYV
ncbi:MAG: diaminopimelate epimerase [Candidatus Omnitrophica bacterium]|nr:diaminopimelate epimerase [Candidatus Omnitrophota bacterium]